MDANKINNNDLMLSKAAKLDEELLKMPNRISETLIGHTILLTGGTGFMGKVFIEKVLRKTPGVAGIYLLVRNKKGKDPKDRLKDVFSNPVRGLVSSRPCYLNVLQYACSRMIDVKIGQEPCHIRR